MNTKIYRELLSKKIHIADEIVNQYGDHAEPDAEILLCCFISAFAALMWPGLQIDKFRFIQFLVDFTPPTSEVQKISIPELIHKLKEDRDISSARSLLSKFYPSSNQEILSSEQVDQDETKITSLLPLLPRKNLREASYAGIIYTDLRCGLIHEYKLSPFMESFGMSERDDIPNYVNMRVAPDENEVRSLAIQYSMDEFDVRMAISIRERHLYLPYKYIREIIDSALNNAFDYWELASSWEKPAPTSWWIQG